MKRSKTPVLMFVTCSVGLLTMTHCEDLHSQETGFCSVSVPGEVFCDDFSDGSVTDGDPVRWRMLFGGSQTVQDGSLVITHSAPSFPASQVAPAVRYTDISVRTQMRLLEGDALGFGVRGDLRREIIYGGGIVFEDVAIVIGGPNETLVETPLELDVRNEDVLLQFDVIGDSLKLWLWPAGTVRPVDPLLSVVDDTIQEGTFYVWAAAGADNPGDSAQSAVFRFVQVATQSIPRRMPGDFNFNGVLDAGDIDLLSTAVRANDNEPAFDLNQDGSVDDIDRTVWVRDLNNTYFGDSNLDGEFNSGDLVPALASGQYEDGIAGNSGWATGDWDGDADTTSADLIFGLADGGYEQGSRAAVPEPSSIFLVGVAILVLFLRASASRDRFISLPAAADV